MPTVSASIVASSPDAILVIDNEGRYQEANPAACRLLGYTREELLQRQSTDVIPHGAAWVAVAEAANRTEGSWRGEIELIRKDGSLAPVEACTVAISGPPGPLYASFLRDVTERKQAVEQVRQNDVRFRSLLRKASDIITILDADGIVQYQSPPIERILGYSPAKLVGQCAFDLIHPDDQAAM